MSTSQLSLPLLSPTSASNPTPKHVPSQLKSKPMSKLPQKRRKRLLSSSQLPSKTTSTSAPNEYDSLRSPPILSARTHSLPPSPLSSSPESNLEPPPLSHGPTRKVWEELLNMPPRKNPHPSAQANSRPVIRARSTISKASSLLKSPSTRTATRTASTTATTRGSRAHSTTLFRLGIDVKDAMNEGCGTISDLDVANICKNDLLKNWLEGLTGCKVRHDLPTIDKAVDDTPAIHEPTILTAPISTPNLTLHQAEMAQIIDGNDIPNPSIPTIIRPWDDETYETYIHELELMCEGQFHESEWVRRHNRIWPQPPLTGAWKTGSSTPISRQVCGFSAPFGGQDNLDPVKNWNSSTNYRYVRTAKDSSGTFDYHVIDDFNPSRNTDIENTVSLSELLAEITPPDSVLRATADLVYGTSIQTLSPQLRRWCLSHQVPGVYTSLRNVFATYLTIEFKPDEGGQIGDYTTKAKHQALTHGYCHLVEERRLFGYDDASKRPSSTIGKHFLAIVVGVSVELFEMQVHEENIDGTIAVPIYTATRFALYALDNEQDIEMLRQTMASIHLFGWNKGVEWLQKLNTLKNSAKATFKSVLETTTPLKVVKTMYITRLLK